MVDMTPSTRTIRVLDFNLSRHNTTDNKKPSVWTLVTNFDFIVCQGARLFHAQITEILPQARVEKDIILPHPLTKQREIHLLSCLISLCSNIVKLIASAKMPI